MADSQEAQSVLKSLPETLSFLPQVITVPILRLYVLAKEYQLNTPAAQLAPMGIIAGMGLVFLGWRVKRLEPWMRKWWLHSPVVFGGARQKWAESVTLFTSTVSLDALLLPLKG